MKLTDWEVGQELIRAQDTLFEIQNELRGDGRFSFADLLYEMGLKIGTAFNKLGSHDFNLRDETWRSEVIGYTEPTPTAQDEGEVKG